MIPKFLRQMRALVDQRYRRAYRSLRNLPAIKFDTLVDAGAHRGSFTEAFLQVHAPSRVVLVEAVPELAGTLRQRYDRRAGFSVVAAALSDRNGEADFELNRSLASSSLLKIDSRNANWFGLDLAVARSVRVPTLTLKRLFEEQELGKIDLLKLDLQGAERLVLTGGADVLPRVRVIYTEVFFEPLYEDAWLFWELNGFLALHGFKLCGISHVAHGRNGDLLQANAIFRQRDL